MSTNHRHFWHARVSVAGSTVQSAVSPHLRLEPDHQEHSRKSPSKARHDRVRSFRRDLKFGARREERLRLFGHVKLVNGEILSIQEAMRRLHAGAKARDDKKPDPNIRDGISKNDILEWSVPESFRDVVNSVGEVDAVAEYPALGITPGVVLVDAKRRHLDPALRHDFFSVVRSPWR